MGDIIAEIMKQIPDGKISDAVFEGANIVLYTKDKEFFLNNDGLIKEVVNTIKKRVELRPDPEVCMEQEKAEEAIKKILPDDAKADQIIFDPMRSMVIIESEKPGVAIGKRGENLQKIREKTLWVPYVRRTPPIRSQIIENIRAVLYQNSDYRRKFLHKTGKRIYNGWLREKKHEWIRLSYLGGGRQVGRSCILLQTQESRILMDCGIDPGSSGEAAYPYLDAPEFKIAELDAVIVSHGHLDHCGLIPYLFKYGYRGPIYCTAPTRDIMALIQLDCVKIARSEGKEPLYTSEEIKEMVKHCIILDYEEVTDITPDVRITFYNNGHILGGAMVHLHIGNGLHNLLYSGDIKFAKTNLLSPAVTKFPRLETLMIEGTYGGRQNVMPPIPEQERMLRDIIINTVKRKGKTLMPVLGSGRAQEIIVMLADMIQKKEIPADLPIYVDGMVWDITAIHTAYPEFLNSTVRRQIFHKDQNPFLIENIKQVGSPKERKEIIEGEQPCCVLATSGMLVGGASVEYLKGLAEQEKNSLVFSSYLGEGSLGKRIYTGEREIGFMKGHTQEVLQIRMEVHKIEITGHADRRELLNFYSRLSPKPKKVLINHGEVSRCIDLSSSLHKSYRVETLAPRNLDCVRIR